MNKKSKREAKMIAKANRFINRKPPESREADDPSVLAGSGCGAANRHTARMHAMANSSPSTFEHASNAAKRCLNHYSDFRTAAIAAARSWAWEPRVDNAESFAALETDYNAARFGEMLDTMAAGGYEAAGIRMRTAHQVAAALAGRVVDVIRDAARELFSDEPTPKRIVGDGEVRKEWHWIPDRIENRPLASLAANPEVWARAVPVVASLPHIDGTALIVAMGIERDNYIRANQWYGDEVWDCELCRGSGCEEIEFCVDDVTTEKIKIQCRMCKGKKIHTDEDYAAFQSRDPALDVIVSLDPNWKVLEESR